MAELNEFALHTPVPPARIVSCHADHELADRGCRGRPSGTPPAGVVPTAGDQPPVPGQQCRRGHREHLAPVVPGDQPGQCREPHPVGWLVADPADLAAKHRVLMPQHQEFDILGHLTPGQHHQAAQQTAREQVGGGEDHSAMIPTPEHCSGHARSSNRAPQGRRRTGRRMAAVRFAPPPMAISRGRNTSRCTRVRSRTMERTQSRWSPPLGGWALGARGRWRAVGRR